MDEKTLVLSIRDILKKEPNYFKSNIEWLDERIEMWDSQFTRIGIIGVTSSGKSTLINAFLGEELLPVGVVPTSGILVTCSKSTKKEANIYFDNGRVEKLSNNEVTPDKIKKYADERDNPENKEGVKNIDVKSPKFILDENIQIIDSPGLDAFGLDKHESITLETLLPTLDICIYITTMKTNSDSISAKIIRDVASHSKPLIIVQNALDSVEDKIGEGGNILKTKEEVAWEHKNRVYRIAKNSNYSDSVDIVQISAKYAIKGIIQKQKELIEESKLNDLIDSINRNVKNKSKDIIFGRVKQIKTHIEELLKDKLRIISTVKEKEDIYKEKLNELKNIEDEKNNIEKSYGDLGNDIRVILKNMRMDLEKANTQIDRLDKREIYGGQSIIENFKDKIGESETKIVKLIREFNNNFNQLLKILNLNPRDYNGVLLPAKRESLGIKTTTIQESKIVEKEGFWGSIERWLGRLLGQYDWGYETVTENTEVLDKPQTKKNLENFCSRKEIEILSSLNQWREEKDKIVKEIEKEIKRREKELKEKSDINVSEDSINKIYNQIEEQLKSINDFLKSNEKLIKQNNTEENLIDDRKTEIIKKSINKNQFYIYRLGIDLVSLHFIKIWEYCQERNRAKIGNFEDIIIWGWDNDSIINFYNRFLYKLISDEETIEFEHTGIIKKSSVNNIYIINENKMNVHQKSSFEILKNSKEKKLCIYILLNTLQEGSAKNQLDKSTIRKFLPNDNWLINWVSQSFLEFKNAENIDEGLESLLNIPKQIFSNYKMGQYLINDSNPLYSILISRLTEFENFITVTDETKIINEINKISYLFNSTEEKNQCSKLIKKYGEIKNKNISRR